MKPIQVLDLRDSGWVDGPGRTVLDTASHIDRERCEIVVTGFIDEHDSGNEYVEEARRRNLRVEVIREKGAFDLTLIRQVSDIVRKNSIDLIHTHDFRSNVLGLYCAKRLGLPVVTTCHGWIANDIKGKLYTATDRFLLRFFNHVIVVSNIMKDHLVARGLPEPVISVVQNALVVDNFEPSAEDQAFRKELGLSPSTRMITNIGRLSPEKGQRQFILAARELIKDFKDVHFVLVGTGEDEGFLRDIVRLNDLSDHVSFVGYRKDMTSIYSSTDLVVQSSWTEGMPNVILEALLMETPVVATDVGGTSEVLDDGNYGLLIDPQSPHHLEEAIGGFLRAAGSHREMAKRGRQSVIARFNHDHRVAKLTRIYEETKGRKRDNALNRSHNLDISRVRKSCCVLPDY